MLAAMQLLCLFAQVEPQVEPQNVSLNSTLLVIVVGLLAAAVGFAMRVSNRQTHINATLTQIVAEHERRITILEQE